MAAAAATAQPSSSENVNMHETMNFLFTAHLAASMD